MTRVATVAGGMFVVAMLLASNAAGGVLAGDPNGIAGWQGTQTFDTVNIYAVTYYTADIDYCVYEPGQFTETFTPESGHEPDSSHYVYAYQIVQITSAYGGYVNRFSVGLNGGDEEEAGIWYIPASGDVDPSNSAFAPFTAGWDFDPAVYVGETSAVLYFSSPFGPELDTASVTGYFSTGDTQMMPSPMPEPGTLALLAVGFAAICGARRRRRARVW